ncbi:MAG TPA: T9SS type A sorting domain-containing protein [Candidatus Kapabacteria bacterium]|nr:T9SS type A sorting domain-containing protein [Candidatus Kapabacteria bacterium]
MEMVFKAYEKVMPLDTVFRITRHDTCGIRTGASVGLDSYETEWPPIVPFDVRWVTSPDIGIPSDSLGDGTYIDIRPVPANVSPYIVDHELLFDLLNDSAGNQIYDTLVIVWDSLPAAIDSIHIEDVSVGPDSTEFGRFFHRYISHQSTFPDSLSWSNPPLIVIQNIRVRVFYDKSVVTASGVNESAVDPRSAALQAFPNPASDHVEFNIPNVSVSRIVLSDMLGRNIREISRMDMMNGMRKFSLTGLSNGVYMISAYGNDQVYRAQIAVVR